MASYRYTTEIHKDEKRIACCDFNSLKEQIRLVHFIVREKLTSEEFPTPYIDETITAFTKALRKKNCSKVKFYQAFHNDNGIILKLIRVGVKK